jgi:predicted dehydrogenase
MTEDRRLCVGLLGAGAQSPLYLAALVENPHVDHVHLAEQSAAQREELARRWGIIQRASAGYRELLGEDELDLVLVDLPLEQRAKAAREALKAGKHVWVVSPAAATLEEFDQLVQAAQQAKRRLFFAQPLRFHPAHQATARLLSQGVLGELYGAQVFCQFSPTTAAAGEDQALDRLLVESVGEVGFLRHLLGPVAQVQAQHLRTGSVLGGWSVSLRHKPAGLSSLWLGWAPPGAAPVAERKLVGSEGWLLVRDDPDDELPLLVFREGEVYPERVRTPLHVHPGNVSAALHHSVQVLRGEAEPVTGSREARDTLEILLECEGLG